MGSFLYPPPSSSAAGGGGSAGFLPATRTVASGAGNQNNVNPGGGFPTGIGRLIVTLAAGDGTWTGLLAGTDGKLLWILNDDAANNLTLAAQNVGSTAANRFLAFTDRTLPAGSSALLCYFTGSINRWVLL